MKFKNNDSPYGEYTGEIFKLYQNHKEKKRPEIFKSLLKKLDYSKGDDVIIKEEYIEEFPESHDKIPVFTVSAIFMEAGEDPYEFDGDYDYIDAEGDIFKEEEFNYRISGYYLVANVKSKGSEYQLPAHYFIKRPRKKDTAKSVLDLEIGIL